MQILLGAQRHKSGNSFADAHFEVIFVGLLVMALKGKSLWVGLVSCQLGGGGWWRQEWSRRHCFFPTLVLFGGGVIVEGHVILGCLAGLNVTPNNTSPQPKAFWILWPAQESSCVADWGIEEGTMETVSLSSSINKWSGMESWRDNKKM